MFFVSRIFSALFSGIVSMCYGFNIKRPSIAQWLSVSIPFFPVLEKLILTLQFYFEGLIKAFVDSICRVLESSLSLAWSESPSPTQMCVYPREFMTLRVAQFSLKIAHLSFSMVLRGPRACGLRPRLWLLIQLNSTMSQFIKGPVII